MTTNYNTNHQIMKLKTEVNRLKNTRFPFSKNVCNTIGKYFFLLIQKHFPKNRKYHEIFNKNNVKISYSCCMANIKLIINMHWSNKHEVIMKKYTTELAKVHLKNIMKTRRNHSIMKNIWQIQNFRKILETWRFHTTSSNSILHLKKNPTNKNYRYLLQWNLWRADTHGF